jgi:hypothetical protein
MYTVLNERVYTVSLRSKHTANMLFFRLHTKVNKMKKDDDCNIFKVISYAYYHLTHRHLGCGAQNAFKIQIKSIFVNPSTCTDHIYQKNLI